MYIYITFGSLSSSYFFYKEKYTNLATFIISITSPILIFKVLLYRIQLNMVQEQFDYTLREVTIEDLEYTDAVVKVVNEAYQTGGNIYLLFN